jgi:hypothetical protein
MRPLLLVFGCLLLLGCAGTAEPPADGTTYPDTTPPADEMTCEEYCPTLPHIQCVGQWNISGTYPDCVCSFECEAAEVPEQPEDQTNETVEPEPPPETPVTDRNMAEMLDDGVEKLRRDFYKDVTGGVFQEKQYKWKRIENVSEGEIIFDSPSFVKFEGKVIQSLYASGLVLFENTETADTEAYGVAIFKDTETVLDDYELFDADYPSPAIEKGARDCWVYEKEHQRNLQGEDLLTYYFKCLRVRDI